MSDETGTGAAPAVSETVASAPAESTAPEQSDAQRQETNRRLMDRLMRTGQKTERQKSSPTAAKDASPQPSPGTTPESEWQPPKTKEEFDRAVQAENDRREAKRARDAEIKAKKDQERWELDNDPQAVIERKRQEIAQEEVQTQTAHAASAFTADLQTKIDRAVLDPIFLDLPETTRATILKANPFQGDALKQREAITKDTLAALKRQYKAEGAREAEEKLRRNPSIIKQQLIDVRDESEEPVTVAGSASSNGKADMDTWIRSSLGKRHR